MIATFLSQELASARFGKSLRAIMERETVLAAVVATPNVFDPAANAQRRRLLSLHRGYGSEDDQYLSRFPTLGVDWAWWAVASDEVCQIQYVDWDYWLELSDHTRRPAVAADRIRAGSRAFDVSNDDLVAAAESLRSGAAFPPLILVSAGKGQRVVVLEGHLRLTAYALVRESIPSELTVLVGTSSAIAQWPCY